jgi:hypothetical protein
MLALKQKKYFYQSDILLFITGERELLTNYLSINYFAQKGGASQFGEYIKLKVDR